jgi:2-oxoglutarate ferredoxin oxidoreductase subunit alpha
MQEALSYMAGSDIPCVVVNIMRVGPGLGGIAHTQGDYNQAVHGGGHGDYHNIVLAPASVQEMFDLTIKAFDLADKYRNPAMIIADAMIGQFQEPCRLTPKEPVVMPEKPWALTGAPEERRSSEIALPRRRRAGKAQPRHEGEIRPHPRKRSALRTRDLTTPRS